MSDNIASSTPEELFEFIRRVKTHNMRSNSTWTIRALQEAFDDRKAWIGIGLNAALVLWEDGSGIMRLAYYAESPGCLNSLIDLMPEVTDRVVCDLVGRDPDVERLLSELPECMFRKYAVYRRMICKDIAPDEGIDLTGIGEAEISEAGVLADMLLGEFDPLTARIPSRDTLLKRISEHEVFILRAGEDIAGFAIFDTTNKKVGLLDYIVVNRSYRRQGVGKKLVNYKWRRANNCNYYYLWVNEDKKGAIGFHESNGFRFDGVSDCIFVVDNDPRIGRKHIPKG